MLNAQRLADEAAQKLKKRDEDNRTIIEDLETEYSRLMEEIASATQRQGEGIVKKIENLRKIISIGLHLNVFEKEKVDHSINQDFLKEIEKLNERIHKLEKLMLDCRNSPNAAVLYEQRHNVNLSNVLKKLTENIDNVASLGARHLDLPHIKQLVQSLATMSSKEASLERLLEEIHGFMDYFNDQWNKFNLTVMEQNISISSLEIKR